MSDEIDAFNTIRLERMWDVSMVGRHAANMGRCFRDIFDDVAIAKWIKWMRKDGVRP